MSFRNCAGQMIRKVGAVLPHPLKMSISAFFPGVCGEAPIAREPHPSSLSV